MGTSFAGHDPVEAFRAQARAAGWPTVCDPDLDFDSPALRDLAATWRRKAAGRAMPERSELVARDVKSTLGKIMLLQRIGGRYRIRLMGTHLTRNWGDLTGQFIDEALPARLLPRWYAFLGTVMELGAPLRFSSRVAFRDRGLFLAEIAAFPLTDDAGEPNMVLGAIYTAADRPWNEVATVMGWRATA